MLEMRRKHEVKIESPCDPAHDRWNIHSVTILNACFSKLTKFMSRLIIAVLPSLQLCLLAARETISAADDAARDMAANPEDAFELLLLADEADESCRMLMTAMTESTATPPMTAPMITPRPTPEGDGEFKAGGGARL